MEEQQDLDPAWMCGAMEREESNQNWFKRPPCIHNPRTSEGMQSAITNTRYQTTELLYHYCSAYRILLHVGVTGKKVGMEVLDIGSSASWCRTARQRNCSELTYCSCGVQESSSKDHVLAHPACSSQLEKVWWIRAVVVMPVKSRSLCGLTHRVREELSNADWAGKSLRHILAEYGTTCTDITSVREQSYPFSTFQGWLHYDPPRAKLVCYIHYLILKAPWIGQK